MSESFSIQFSTSYKTYYYKLSGGMIWSCCVDLVTSGTHDEESSQPGPIHNASMYSLSIVNNKMRY
jgi:hypothetical protein